MKGQVLFIVITLLIIFEIIFLISLFFIPIEEIKSRYGFDEIYGLFPASTSFKNFENYYNILSYIVLGLIIYFLILSAFNIRHLKCGEDELPKKCFIIMGIIFTILVGIVFTLFFGIGRPILSNNLQSLKLFGFYYLIATIAIVFIIGALYFIFLPIYYPKENYSYKIAITYDLYRPERV